MNLKRKLYLLNSKIYHYKGQNNHESEPIYEELLPGKYLIECYGAQGGSGLTDLKILHPGGKGAYTSGLLNVKKAINIYLYIGGRGADANDHDTFIPGGWNGGGNGKFEDTDNDHTGAGGGATDVRLEYGNWNDENSLKSRIMVAAGGSGSAYSSYGAPGGDITGYIINSYNSQNFERSSTNQTHGNDLGAGENGFISNDDQVPYSGGGGGYYGGQTRSPISTTSKGYIAVSSSGSSYISGHYECPSNVIAKDSTEIIFIKPLIVNGFQSFPSCEGSSLITGNEGDGCVKITQINQVYSIYCKINDKSKYIIIFLIPSINKY